MNDISLCMKSPSTQLRTCPSLKWRTRGTSPMTSSTIPNSRAWGGPLVETSFRWAVEPESKHCDGTHAQSQSCSTCVSLTALHPGAWAQATLLPHSHGAHEAAAVPSTGSEEVLIWSGGSAGSSCCLCTAQTDQEESQGGHYWFKQTRHTNTMLSSIFVLTSVEYMFLW